MLFLVPRNFLIAAGSLYPSMSKVWRQELVSTISIYSTCEIRAPGYIIAALSLGISVKLLEVSTFGYHFDLLVSAGFM